MKTQKIKISVADIFLDAQANLNALQGSSGNIFANDVWKFYLQKKEISIDFSVASNLEVARLKSLEHPELDIIDITKFLWLESVKSISPENYKRKFAGIALFWDAISFHEVSQITRDNLEDVVTFMLCHRWDNNTTMYQNNPMSNVSFRVLFSIDSWRKTLLSLGFELIAPGISREKVIKVLKLLIPRLTDGSLTYADWVIGNNYNSLTLDYGQYYVEHCLDFFDRHIALATAVASTIREIPTFALQIGTPSDLMSKWVIHFLEGSSALDLFQRLNSQNKCRPLNEISAAFSSVSNHFQDVYFKSHFTSYILKDSTLSLILGKLGHEATITQIDRMRSIVWLHLNQNCISDLLESSIPPVCPEKFESIFTQMRADSHSSEFGMPHKKYFEEIGLTGASNARDFYSSFPRQLVRTVEQTGLTILVALTGWRKSEFGFPASALISFKNEDILDQYAFPKRYLVDWYVYKTSGQIREKREITFHTAIFAERIKLLVGANLDQPCLYRYSATNSDPFKSEAMVDRAVCGLWRHYVFNYPGFKTIDDLENWKALEGRSRNDGTLTSPDPCEIDRLLPADSKQDWEKVNPHPALKIAWQRSRDEWPLLDFFFAEPSLKSKRGWLKNYRSRTLKLEWLELLDSNLSQDTKDWIHTLSESECNSNIVTRAITNELVADCLYPTPHGFRHMWAEAVYRRFDGDAGWMIRSQFKHISRSMWLAYIRDKDNRADHLIAKRRVINSLVRNYLDNDGLGYAGQLHIWIRRLIRKTSILTFEEQEQFVNRIATTEITDVKANPWGYCLLKSRTKSKAQCAEFGEPQRHNASPANCSQCAHNLMLPTNIDWMLLQVPSHISAVQNSLVPSIFKRPSYQLLKSIAKQLRMLAPDHEALPELQDILNTYAPAGEIPL